MREDDIFPYMFCLVFRLFTAKILHVLKLFLTAEFGLRRRGRHCLPGVKAEIFKYDFTGGKPQILYCRRIVINKSIESYH